MSNRTLLWVLVGMGGVLLVLGIVVLVVVVSGPGKTVAVENPTEPPARISKHEMSVTEFLATKPTSPKTFTLRCRLQASLPVVFPWEEEKFWSLHGREVERGGSGISLCVENNTAAGEFIFETLKDGKDHVLEVSVVVFSWEYFGVLSHVYEVKSAKRP